METFQMGQTFVRFYFLLFIGLFSVVKIQAQSAKINSVRTEHNIYHKGMKGIRIHIHFSVTGMKGNNVRAIAFFYDKNRQPLKTTYSGYRTTSGNVCTYKDYKNIPYNNTEWKNFTLFIPYKAMNLTAGRHTCYFRVHIRSNNSSYALTNSKYYVFSAMGSDTKPIRNANDTYSETTIDEAKGTITTIQTQKCPHCFNGICGWCNGRGGTVLMTGYNRCPICFGSGKCKHCGGTGISKSKFIYNTVTKTGMLIDLQTGIVTYTGSDMNIGNNNMGDNDNSSNRDRINTGKTTCTYCKGTGKDPSPKYGPDYTGGAVTTYRYCSICGKTTQSHYHDVCPGCRGLGYY